MNKIQDIIKSGVTLTQDKIKLFFIVLVSTIFLTGIIDHIFSKTNQETQVLWLMIVLLTENFLTCGVYGSLKKILSGTKLTCRMLMSNGFTFFLRFLLIKMIFIFFVIIIYGLAVLAVKATSEISVPAAAGIVLLWLIWIAVPAYYFVLALFAPIVLFSQDYGIMQSIKTGIMFCRKKLDRILVISFSYFTMIVLLVYLPGKVYNIMSGVWTIYKSTIVSFLEIGFISSLFLLYQEDLNHEGNV